MVPRGFNDAINGFNDDGWSLMNCDGAEDVIVSINSTKNLSNSTNSSNSLSFLGGVLCAKASMLFQVSVITISGCKKMRIMAHSCFFLFVLAECTSSCVGTVFTGASIRMGRF